MDGVLGFVRQQVMELREKQAAVDKAAGHAGLDFKVYLVEGTACIRHIGEGVLLFIPVKKVEEIEVVLVGALHHIGAVVAELCGEGRRHLVDDAVLTGRHDEACVCAEELLAEVCLKLHGRDAYLDRFERHIKRICVKAEKVGVPGAPEDEVGVVGVDVAGIKTFDGEFRGESLVGIDEEVGILVGRTSVPVGRFGGVDLGLAVIIGVVATVI